MGRKRKRENKKIYMCKYVCECVCMCAYYGMDFKLFMQIVPATNGRYKS